MTGKILFFCSGRHGRKRESQADERVSPDRTL